MPSGPNKMQPYDALPPLPPEGIETIEVMRAVTSAARALAQLNGSIQTLPDPRLLIHAIPLQEAQASLAIENIVTTQDALFQADSATLQSADPAVREALRYRTVLQQASARLRREELSMAMLIDVCSGILDQPVRLRDHGDFVHLRDGTGTPVYTPPGGGFPVQRLASNLESYLQGDGDGVDPLVQMAVAHYQFEAIHPFADGNGRTGRILNILILEKAGLLDWPVLYLSHYIIHRKEAYYRLLADVTFKGAWEPWLLWVLRGVEETAKLTIERVARVTKLQRATATHLAMRAPVLLRRGILDVLFRRPTCKVANLVDAGIAKRQTAATYLKELEQLGILESEKHGREIIYRHSALLDALR